VSQLRPWEPHVFRSSSSSSSSTKNLFGNESKSLCPLDSAAAKMKNDQPKLAAVQQHRGGMINSIDFSYN
jgi:hypothetical protein